MKKRKLKKFVLPTIYALVVLVTFVSISFLNASIFEENTDYNYSKGIIQEVTQEVLNSNVDEKVFKRPYISENVTIKTSYYNIDDDKEKQANSLIFYENTYMPSTGVFYTAQEEFDVTAVFDGKVSKIDNDDILGTVIEIVHNTDLTTYYYSVKDVIIKVGDSVTAGSIIGKSSPNKINNENNILFEVYYQGKSLDPEKFYLMNPNELQ